VSGSWIRAALAVAGLAAIAAFAAREVASSSGGSAPASARPAARLPAIMLWAWEQPQDLRFVDPEGAGIAFLAATLTLQGDRVVVEPRRQPLRAPRGAVLVAVGRVEIGGATPALDAAQRARLVRALVDLGRRPGVAGVQVDFDAPRSARDFYRALLADLRRELPPTTVLSMTALASWCMADDWVAGLPVDEAVPMLFRMGADDHAIRADLAARGRLDCASCRGSVGLATDEALPRVRADRTYLFHAGAWTEDALRQSLAALEHAR
jgi:hypothetical protein